MTTSPTKRELSEAEMVYLEAKIPELAALAFKLAEFEALTACGKVVKAVNGKVIELYADGSTRVLKEIEPLLSGFLCPSDLLPSNA